MFFLAYREFIYFLLLFSFVFRLKIQKNIDFLPQVSFTIRFHRDNYSGLDYNNDGGFP
ncbi:hypothetical protein HOLDEFILI_02079 [Holdemania filiformis DSM 12042]|uniref:Uncharacterized protein n=1 Tax=Holdemania filiformis DSM 12042 TaxID=545696 RepID=B9Y8D2_9FIRM|nr:hypothetical protein HOLDEFILI_02079 [Holdemania filiformis DSM 12042]